MILISLLNKWCGFELLGKRRLELPGIGFHVGDWHVHIHLFKSSYHR